jgi:hypothetical protein
MPESRTSIALTGALLQSPDESRYRPVSVRRTWTVSSSWYAWMVTWTQVPLT